MVKAREMVRVAEDLNEMGEQLRKQVSRIRELRVKKVEEPGTSHRYIPRLKVLTLLRCVLWHTGRQRGSAQCRRHDRHFNGADRVHAVHCRTVRGF